MLQTFICQLPNAEYSFILPVKFPSVPLSLPRTAPGCQGSMARTKVILNLEHSSEITPAFAQVSQGFEATSIAKACQPPPNAGSASAFHSTTTERETYGGTLEAPSQTQPWPQKIPSWLAEGYHRGRSVTLCLAGWLFWMTPSQVSFMI